jgi:hypothetical protein
MTITAHAPLIEFFGMVVKLRLQIGDHVAEGKGLVASVRPGDGLSESRTIIHVAGPMQEVVA